VAVEAEGMSEAVEFQAAIEGIEAAYRDALRAFADWFEMNWQHQGREKWEQSYAEPYPGDEYIEGHNAGVRSVQIALDAFLDDVYS
jgi:hypothetical protein